MKRLKQLSERLLQHVSQMEQVSNDLTIQIQKEQGYRIAMDQERVQLCRIEIKRLSMVKEETKAELTVLLNQLKEV